VVARNVNIGHAPCRTLTTSLREKKLKTKISPRSDSIDSPNTVIQFITNLQCVPFIVSRSTVVLSRDKTTSAATRHDTCVHRDRIEKAYYFKPIWKAKVRYRARNSPSQIPIISQIHKIHLHVLFSRLNFNIILSSTTTLSKLITSTDSSKYLLLINYFTLCH